MNKIVGISRICRKNARVLLDNGESDKIPSHLADIGLSYKKYKNNFYVINIESKKIVKPNATLKLLSHGKIIEAAAEFDENNYDLVIKENNKNILVDKMLIAKKEGYVLVRLISDYFPTKEDSPRHFLYAMYNKPDSNKSETGGA
jgi:hypothetical protein